MARDRRSLVNYERGQKIIEAVSKDTVEERAWAVFNVLDDMRAYRFEWLAVSAEESLRLALADSEVA